MPTYLMGVDGQIEKFFAEADLAILPQGWESFASPVEKQAVNRFESSDGQIILYDYRIDRGSYLYVEAQIKKCMNRKRSQ